MTALWPSPFARAVVIIQDDTFDDGDWTSLELIDTTSNDSFTFSAAQSLAGGNPDAYRMVVQQLDIAGPPGFSIESGHIFTPMSYDPSFSSGIDTIQFDLDGIGMPGGPAGAMGYGAVIEQDGMYYVEHFGQTLNGAGWEPFGGSPLAAAMFDKVVGGTGVNPAQHPDFSSAGGVLRFGFFVSNGDVWNAVD